MRRSCKHRNDRRGCGTSDVITHEHSRIKRRKILFVESLFVTTLFFLLLPFSVMNSMLGSEKEDGLRTGAPRLHGFGRPNPKTCN